MSSSKIKTHNLNVSDRYVPNWGPWEVVREIVTNAMDACSDWELTNHNDDHVAIFTSTVPRIGDILVIGQGTKEIGGVEIGQFGEGLKLAALACVRSNGKFHLTTPFGTIRFFLKEIPEFEATVLHCEIDEDGEKCKEGCYVDIRMMDIGTVSEGRFLKNKSGRRLKKTSPDHLNIFLKGVWISRTDEKSLYDWNLVDATINRDRNVVDRINVNSEICTMIMDNLTVSDAEELLRSPDAFEVDTLDHCYFPSADLKEIFRKAFINVFGSRAVLGVSGNDRANEYAVLKGYNIIPLPNRNLEKLLGTVKTSENLIPADVTVKLLQELRVESNAPVLIDIRRLLDRLKFPIELCVFRDSNKLPENYHGNVVGGGLTGLQMWLRQDLLESRRGVLESVLMFASSARSTHPGSSLAFEGSMASLGAAIAEAWLDDITGENSNA